MAQGLLKFAGRRSCTEMPLVEERTLFRSPDEPDDVWRLRVQGVAESMERRLREQAECVSVIVYRSGEATGQARIEGRTDMEGESA